MDSEIVALRAGDLHLELLPVVGGAVAGLWLERPAGRLHLLRPAGAEARRRGDPGGMGCFPLVPYSNRIREGRFTFAGRDVQLPLNFGDHPHSIHGHGWQAPWQVTQSDAATAALAYAHEADSWPWRYRATQTFQLGTEGLTVSLRLENQDEHDMPAGLGFHPFFPRSPATRLTTRVERVWRTDAETMPTELTPLPAEWDLTAGWAPDAVAVDNGFTGWSREARIADSQTGLDLTLTGSPGLEFVVVYSPAGEPFFCVEPVSHCTDAFNLAAQGRTDTGMRVLAPGEAWSVTMALRLGGG